MAVKCPKKMNRWTHLGRLLQFFKDHRRKIVAYADMHRPEQTPTSAWWVITFAVSPAINAINVTFIILQNRSLLIAQQEQHIHTLIGLLVAMFCVEIIHENDNDAQYMSIGSMRILVDAIVEHIRDQGLFAIAYYNDLDADDKNDIICTVATYAISLVTGLMGVKVERDSNNMCLESDAPPVLLAQLIAIRHSKFVNEVLVPYRDHISAFWSLEDVDQTKADHRNLLNLYASDQILRVAIDRHTIETSFDDAWDCASGWVRSFMIVLWRPGNHVRQHDVSRKRFLYFEVGDGREPYLLDAPVARGCVSSQAAGAHGDVVRMHPPVHAIRHTPYTAIQAPTSD